ncbi:hypothetical protein PPACK8108_LOCUS286 [Phakopsora pachyrhizi]|uniref:Uncharacterized protein n=1 Tax=Phakopsora pachyrhizi TaxID=170000 RepID=A0AAV0AEL7_PHAPC|nr:hypothetical protein PPACK8108_LOCUS286 [Phakopsora pachyrhizi]
MKHMLCNMFLSEFDQILLGMLELAENWKKARAEQIMLQFPESKLVDFYLTFSAAMIDAKMCGWPIWYRFICVGDSGEQDLEMYIEKSVLELENKSKARPIAPPKPQNLCGTRTKEVAKLFTSSCASNNLHVELFTSQITSWPIEREWERSLLQLCQLQQAFLDAGGLLDFNPQTSWIREDLTWQAASPAPGLRDHRVEITGPVDCKMVIKCLELWGSNLHGQFQRLKSKTSLLLVTLEHRMMIKDAKSFLTHTPVLTHLPTGYEPRCQSYS